jgi:hypothetical protein
MKLSGLFNGQVGQQGKPLRLSQNRLQRHFGGAQIERAERLEPNHQQVRAR